MRRQTAAARTLHCDVTDQAAFECDDPCYEATPETDGQVEHGIEPMDQALTDLDRKFDSRTIQRQSASANSNIVATQAEVK